MGNLSEILHDQRKTSKFGPPRILSTVEPAEQLRLAMSKDGYTVPGGLCVDGLLHRFPTSGKKDDDAGWYVAYPDGIPAGSYGDWRTGENYTWRADIGRKLSPAEENAVQERLEEARKVREEERLLQAQKAAAKAQRIWEEALPAVPDHPYLIKKRIGPHELRQTKDGKLVAPLYTSDGTLSTLEFIAEDGDKKFLFGGVHKGCFTILGDFVSGEPVYIVEGYATGASVFEATGHAVLIAYNAGNIEPVARQIRMAQPDAHIVIVADNDPERPDNPAASHIGERKAKAAAEAIGAEVILPPVVGMDANDYACAGYDLLSLLEPPSRRWLVRGDSVLTQPAPISWMIKHWLQEKALVMVHGQSGSGKTFIVLDWLLSITTGQADWFGNKVKRGDVVYLCGEGHIGLRARLAAWAQVHQVDSVGNFVLSKGPADLDKPEGLRLAVDAIESSGVQPKVIAVDTLNRFLSGDENSAQDTKRFLDSCTFLMERFQCTVLIIHHTGLASGAKDRARGSSAWKGALDVEISVEREQGGSIKLVQKKVKDSEPVTPLYVELQSTEITGWFDEDGEPVKSAVIVRGSGSPGTEKLNKKTADDIAQLKAAYRDCGELDLEGRPYITRSGWKQFIISQGASSESAKKMLDGNEPRLIGRLLRSQIIKPFQAGFIITDDALTSALKLEKKVEK